MSHKAHEVPSRKVLARVPGAQGNSLQRLQDGVCMFACQRHAACSPLLVASVAAVQPCPCCCSRPRRGPLACDMPDMSLAVLVVARLPWKTFGHRRDSQLTSACARMFVQRHSPQSPCRVVLPCIACPARRLNNTRYSMRLGSIVTPGQLRPSRFRACFLLVGLCLSTCVSWDLVSTCGFVC